MPVALLGRVSRPLTELKIFGRALHCTMPLYVLRVLRVQCTYNTDQTLLDPSVVDVSLSDLPLDLRPVSFGMHVAPRASSTWIVCPQHPLDSPAQTISASRPDRPTAVFIRTLRKHHENLSDLSARARGGCVNGKRSRSDRKASHPLPESCE